MWGSPSQTSASVVATPPDGASRQLPTDLVARCCRCGDQLETVVSAADQESGLMSLIPVHLYCSHVKMMKVAEFTVQLVEAGGQGVGVDHTAVWLRPCRQYCGCDATSGELCPKK